MGSSGFKNEDVVNIRSVQLVSQSNCPDLELDSAVGLIAKNGKLVRIKSDLTELQIDVAPQFPVIFYLRGVDVSGPLRFVPGIDSDQIPFVAHQSMILDGITIISPDELNITASIRKNGIEIFQVVLEGETTRIDTSLGFEFSFGDTLDISLISGTVNLIAISAIFRILTE